MLPFSWLCLCSFIVRIPDGFPLEAAGPVLCAGVSMYSPLVYWKVERSLGVDHVSLTEIKFRPIEVV